MSSQCRCNSLSSEILELIECFEYWLCEIGHRASNPAEGDDDLFVSNARQCVDDLGGGLTTKQAHQQGARFDTADTAEGQGGRGCHLGATVVEEFDQHPEVRSGRTHAPAGGRADRRLGVV